MAWYGACGYCYGVCGCGAGVGGAGAGVGGAVGVLDGAGFVGDGGEVGVDGEEGFGLSYEGLDCEGSFFFLAFSAAFSLSRYSSITHIM